jgi:hypothetical protein
MARKWVAGSKEKPSPTGEKLQSGPAGFAYFDDWRHFCFALREIAAGAKGRTLSGLEAQQRAQAVLAERGYTWPMCPQAGSIHRTTDS